MQSKDEEKKVPAPVEVIPTPVQIVAASGGLTLVQWGGRKGETCRSWVKPDMIVESSGRDSTVVSPERGLPYGDDMSLIVPKVEISAEGIMGALRERGVWTYRDVVSNRSVVHGALMAALGTYVSDIIANAQSAVNEL